MVKVTSIISIILASIALVQCAPVDANNGNRMKLGFDSVDENGYDGEELYFDSVDANNGIRGKSDFEAGINNVLTVVKEPLAWASGTSLGLASGAIKGVRQGISGLSHHGVGGLFRGITGGVAEGTAKGFEAASAGISLGL